MAFHCKSYNSEPSFNPLFRFLEDFEKHSARCQAPVPQWQPKFDVRETEQAFELHGEFPGVSKDAIHIKFADPQTVVVHGKTERVYSSSSPAQQNVEKTATDEQAKETESKRNSYQATVEDESEFETVSHDGEESPKEAETKVDQHAEVVSPTQVEEKPVENVKYWLTERSVGEFSRSFHFPTLVDHEAVTAKFKNGILSVVVPKAKKHEVRRISIV